MEKVDGIEIGK